MGIHRMPVQLLKGVFMWVPLGVVGIGLTAYVFQQLPNRLPKMARVMGSMDPNSASEMNAAASPDIRRAGRVESPRAVDRGHLPNATMPPSVQIGSDTNDPKVFPKSSMPADANHGKNLTVEPQIDVETLSMLKQLRELEPESDAAKAIKSQMLDRLLTEFSRNQEQQKTRAQSSAPSGGRVGSQPCLARKDASRDCRKPVGDAIGPSESASLGIPRQEHARAVCALGHPVEFWFDAGRLLGASGSSNGRRCRGKCQQSQ